ncbi:CLUMA_CG017981, isoform A [Clunio marinus]|uniref:Polypeptide N-acetylgalactosaminyltransferase n=1 Tax=Clunio marinus TaxID=568069 RepID=A0A1J1IXC1_9DIPT|nr:CLUMA_CG017981, isoform A [Clunio marinus]
MQIKLKRRSLIGFSVIIVIYFIYLRATRSNREAKNVDSDLFISLDGENNNNQKSRFRDWNDYKLTEEEKTRNGFGEHGAAAILTNSSEIDLNEKLYHETGFSVVVSNKISVNRSLDSVVHSNCSNVKYYATLPNVSVIIIFHNEVLSVLLRTIHSVINRTPAELLHEVILVNDYSTNAELYDPLKKYLLENFPPKVKIKNLEKRSGLIVTRMEGARSASGEVLVFFDSHIEVQNNWLPPLLQPIVDDRKISTLPIIDYLDPFTFEYLPGQSNFQGSRGVIDWYLDFQELPKLPNDQMNDLKPYPNPIMLGAAFAIDRKFFIDELGGYDEGLQIWNGENYELSFKLWMCANRILTVPCSRVAHYFRQINPSRVSKDDYVARNFMRIAEVWLDEYKTLPKQLEPKRYENVDPGDLTIPKAVKKRLNCKPFRWFLNNIAPDMIERFPPLADPPKFASGAIQSVANPRLCIDNMGKLNDEKIGLDECSHDMLNPSLNQNFIYSFLKDIRQDHGRHEFCLDSYELRLTGCNNLSFGNQFWIYDKDSKEIIMNTSTKKCLTIILVNDSLTLDECNNEMTQKWNFAYVNETAYEYFNDIFGYRSILS